MVINDMRKPKKVIYKRWHGESWGLIEILSSEKGSLRKWHLNWKRQLCDHLRTEHSWYIFKNRKRHGKLHIKLFTGYLLKGMEFKGRRM